MIANWSWDVVPSQITIRSGYVSDLAVLVEFRTWILKRHGNVLDFSLPPLRLLGVTSLPLPPLLFPLPSCCVSQSAVYVISVPSTLVCSPPRSPADLLFKAILSHLFSLQMSPQWAGRQIWNRDRHKMRDLQSSVTMPLDDRRTGFFFSTAYQMSVVKSKCLVVTAPPPHCLFKLSPADLRDPKGGHTSRNGWWIPGIQICNCSWNIHLKYDSLFHTSPLNYKLLFFCKYN